MNLSKESCHFINKFLLQEVQDSMNMFQQPGSSLPSMEELFTNIFGGGGSTKAAKKPSNNKIVKRRERH